jgi:cellulose synthase/poly-beta-1,6-N-acetylglucosamine synthase-like glycosyltransferase
VSETFLLAWLLIGIGATIYAYVGFPILLSVLARLLPRRRVGPPEGARTDATVTVIVPAYNEEASLAAKIQNLLAADYPRHLLEVIVVSDASTDATDDIARGFAAQGVRLIVQETRRGKTAGLNRAIATAHGEIVVFTDANAAYEPGVIRRLTDYFREAKVGLVTGYTRYSVTADGTVGEVTNLYTSLERTIKRGESNWGRCVGADGAVFAMRRGLYRMLRDDDINDFILPLMVITQGAECLFADDVFCAEHPGKNLESEFRRQSRITNRTLRGLSRNAHLLNPARFPLFSFFLFSHKVVRFMVPAFLGISAMCLVLLAGMGNPYATVAVMVAGAVGLAAVIAATSERSRNLAVARPLLLLNAFIAINLAVLHGWLKFLFGHRDVTWHHDRAAVTRDPDVAAVRGTVKE